MARRAARTAFAPGKETTLLLPEPVTDLLARRPMPELAAALRARSARIVELWNEAVNRFLPHADPLTTKQVRDSIPNVLEKIALALESDRPEAVGVLAEVGLAHGVARFQQQYNIEEVLVEYRLLRRIVFDELQSATRPAVDFTHAIVVDMGIDTALQRGVTGYVRHMGEKLQAAAAAESKYLSFLSHDLRNHLNGVSLMLEALKLRFLDAPQPSDEIQEIDALLRAVHETVEGMDRLLQAERLRKQAVKLKLGPVHLRELAATIIAPLAGTASYKGVAIENVVPVEAVAQSDRELIALLLQNLLGNAVKFSTRGVVRVGAVEDPLGWRLYVSDQGPGIAPDRVRTLFDAFTRGETHGQPGVGLGLNIASHAARLLGSDLQVESKPGEGSTFSLTLPPGGDGAG
jgi:signal transduction histidine kinase